MGAQAERELTPLGVAVDVRDEDWLAGQGFGGVLAVGGGSANPPRLIEAAWRPPRAVRGVHECGFVHGRVSGARIRFDDSGCPVLLGFGGARPATPAGLVDDWERCVALVESILARAEVIEPDEASRVLAVVRGLSEPVGDWLPRNGWRVTPHRRDDLENAFGRSGPEAFSGGFVVAERGGQAPAPGR